MANFIPLKNYILFCIDKLITSNGLQGPFLDVGCGRGDVSKFLSEQYGWHGKAIDISEEAVEHTKSFLAQNEYINVSKSTIHEETELYGVILLLDVIEHIENDFEILEKANTLLNEQGAIIITVPSNPPEWRWDDEFYGHYRRYRAEDIRLSLEKAGFKVLTIWDFTYPVFWLMRRMYTFLKRPPKENDAISQKTEKSSLRDAWAIPGISGLLQHENWLWRCLYKIQFKYFKENPSKGHEIIILGRK